MLSKKWAAMAAIVTVMSLLLTACAPAATPQVIEKQVVVEKPVVQTVVVEKEKTVIVEKVVVATAEPAAAQPKQLVLAASTDILNFDPGRVLEVWGYVVLHATYDTLVSTDPNQPSKIIPNLATSWEVSPDAMTYTFKLRTGIKFTTGNTLTAEDVAWCLTRVVNLKAAPAYMLGDVDKVEAVDAETVKITMKRPSAILLYQLATPVGSIMDSKVLQEHGGLATADAADKDKAEQFLSNNSIGTGPFILVSNEPDYKVVVAKSPTYWGEPKPKIDEMIILTVRDPTAQRFMVERGDADIAFNLSAEQVNNALKNPALKVVGGTTFGQIDLEMTTKPDRSKQISDPKVQKALKYALDYSGYIQLAGGYGSTVCGYITPAQLGALPNTDPACIKRDLDKAKALLAEAGYPSGFDAKLTFESTGVWFGVSLPSVAEKVQADLKDIGVNVTLDPQEGMVGYQMSRRGELELFINMWISEHADGGSELGWWCPGQTVAMRYGWSADKAPELDVACKQATGIADPAARAEAYQAIQRTMLDIAPFASIMAFDNHSVMRAEVTGYAYDPVMTIDVRFVDKQ